MDWHLEIGEEASRTSIQALHKGSNSRGISAPARGSGLNNIMLWWDPTRGGELGYADGWVEDGSSFFFSGTGQYNDQSFGPPHSENGRVRDHIANSDRLRLLRYIGKNRVRYVAELELVDWWWRDGADRSTRPRKMVEFKLRPIGGHHRDPDDPIRAMPAPSVELSQLREPPAAPSQAALEALNKREFTSLLRTRHMIGVRREAELVRAFASWLYRETGRELTGLTIPYAAEQRSLRADGFLPASGDAPPVLLEAKASTARESIRMGIGQLLDYRRFVDPNPRLCLLVPSKAPVDMLPLLEDVGIGVAYPESQGFEIYGLELF